MAETRLAFKVWLETEEGFVFGPGVYGLLRRVRETGTLKEAAESLGMSYRYAWGLVRKAEEKLGHQMLRAHKGGRDGGGGAELTEVGLRFLEEFSEIEAFISQLSRGGWWMEKSRARNRVEGRIIKVEMDGDRADVSLKLTEPTVLHLSVSKELVTDESIAQGDTLNVELNPSIISIKGEQESTEK